MASNYLYINTRDEFFRIDCSKIVYMEGDGNYTNIVLANKVKASICLTLAQMQKLISDSLREHATIFARVGKRFIINRNYIYHINVLRQHLVVTDGENFVYQLPISKEALRQLKLLMLAGAKSQSETK